MSALHHQSTKIIIKNNNYIFDSLLQLTKEKSFWSSRVEIRFILNWMRNFT